MAIPTTSGTISKAKPKSFSLPPKPPAMNAPTPVIPADRSASQEQAMLNQRISKAGPGVHALSRQLVTQIVADRVHK